MKELHYYAIALEGKSLEEFKSGKISVIDILSEELGIPQENIVWLGNNPRLQELINLELR